MKMRTLLTVALLGVTGAAAAAGDQLSIRLVEAGQGAGDISPELRDVARLLKRLNYPVYKLLASAAAGLPANQTLKLTDDLQVKLTGAQADLRVVVIRRRKKILAVNIVLRKPFLAVLPGATRSGGRLLLIILPKPSRD